jgi:hypothetical protein
VNYLQGLTVRVEDGWLIERGSRVQLGTYVENGEYWVVEDLGRKLLLQPKGGGPNVTAHRR